MPLLRTARAVLPGILLETPCPTEFVPCPKGWRHDSIPPCFPDRFFEESPAGSVRNALASPIRHADSISGHDRNANPSASLRALEIRRTRADRFGKTSCKDGGSNARCSEGRRRRFLIDFFARFRDSLPRRRKRNGASELFDSALREASSQDSSARIRNQKRTRSGFSSF